MKWAFVAPPDDVADELQRMGYQAAMEWAKSGGIEEGREIDLAEAAEPAKVTGNSFVRPGPVVGLGSGTHEDTKKEGRGG